MLSDITAQPRCHAGSAYYVAANAGFARRAACDSKGLCAESECRGLRVSDAAKDRGAAKEAADNPRMALIQQGAEEGYARAQYLLGLFYKSGMGVDIDFAKALYWFRKAAEQDEVGAAQEVRWLERALEDEIPHKPVEGLPEKAQIIETILDQTEVITPGYFLIEADLRKINIEHSLSENGVPERASIALSELAELAVNDPPLFAAKMAAADKVRVVAATGRPPSLGYREQEEVRARRARGETQASIAQGMNVSEATISRLITKQAAQQR